MNHRFDKAIEAQVIENKMLQNIALKINKIPTKFTTNGKLDLDKIHLALMDYQK